VGLDGTENELSPEASGVSADWPARVVSDESSRVSEREPELVGTRASERVGDPLDDPAAACSWDGTCRRNLVSMRSLMYQGTVS
jgi:hypothetical protein